jgi:hypothetical protein
MENGWKPMPVVLKVIFVLEAIGLFLSCVSVTSSYQVGFDYFGQHLEGITAVNIFFLTNIVLPVTLLVGFWMRQKWGFLFGALYFFYCSISTLFGYLNIDKAIAVVKTQMTPNPLVTDEMFYASAIIGILIGFSFNIACMILIIVKRKFFTETINKEEELSS